ncbi:hypothetical protein DL770_005975 [Monosporascus sp. CRB-9-2]|nr:hypothetical protein DL770_005975 [Monosporascus sp. CRB-9-2]
MSSPSRENSQEGPPSIGEDWYDLSAEGKIKWLLDTGDSQWGWVIYRCTYKPELDVLWESLKRLIVEETRRSAAHSDAPGIIEKVDWRFIEDPELEGASRNELKRRFRAWARTEITSYDIDNTTDSRGSRYSYFIQIDEEALLSLLNDPNNLTSPASPPCLKRGHVKIVRAWEDSDESGDAFDNEDWMKIQPNMIAPYFYIELDNDESWYTHYMPPPHGTALAYLGQHLQTMHLGMYCQRCQKPSRSFQAKKQHVIDSPQHNVCVRCPQQPDFHSENEPNEHLEKKHYFCVPCGRKFGGADQRAQHDVAVHNKCEECLHYLNSASDLKNFRTLYSSA